MPKDLDKIKEDLQEFWKECPNCDMVVSVRKGKCPICKSVYDPEKDEFKLVEVPPDEDVKEAKGDVDADPDPFGDWLAGKKKEVKSDEEK